MATKAFTKLSSIPELLNFVRVTLGPAALDSVERLVSEVCGFIQSNPSTTFTLGTIATSLYALYSRHNGPEDNRDQRDEQLEELAEALRQFRSEEAPSQHLRDMMDRIAETVAQQGRELREMSSVVQNMQDQSQNQPAMVRSERPGFQEQSFTAGSSHATAGSSQESSYDMENSDTYLTSNDESRPNSPVIKVTPKKTKGEFFSSRVDIDLEGGSSREYRNEASKTTLGDETNVSRENDSPYLLGGRSVSFHSTSSREGESPVQDDGEILSKDDEVPKSSTAKSLATYANASDSKSPKSSGAKRSVSKRKRKLSKDSPFKKPKPMKTPRSVRRSKRANKGKPPPQHELTLKTPQQQKQWENSKRRQIKEKSREKKQRKAAKSQHPDLNDADTEQSWAESVPV